MGCNCGGGSTQAFHPSTGAVPAQLDADGQVISPMSDTYPHVPVHLRPGRQGVPVPAWLPRPQGERAVPTHEQ